MIKAGDSADGPFTRRLGSQTAGTQTTFDLNGTTGALLPDLDHEPRRPLAASRSTRSLRHEPGSALSPSGLRCAVAGASAAAGPTLTSPPSPIPTCRSARSSGPGSGFLYLPRTSARSRPPTPPARTSRPFATHSGPRRRGDRAAPCPSTRLWPDGVYCHTPDNRIFRLARDGSSLTQLAQLPGERQLRRRRSSSTRPAASATRCSPRRAARRRTAASVFAVRQDGRVQTIGALPRPRRRRDSITSPRRASAAPRACCLLSIDQDSVSGRVLAIDRQGAPCRRSRAASGTAPTRSSSIPPRRRRRPPGAAAGSLRAGHEHADVYFAAAPQLQALRRQVLVGTELPASFWLDPADGHGFGRGSSGDRPAAASLNLEGAAYVP